jgi:hypothetical protein
MGLNVQEKTKELNDHQQLLKDAFALAAKNCGSKPRMLAALDCTVSWYHTCIRLGTVPLELAMKLEVLTKGEYQFKDMCPDRIEEINAVSQYLI